MEFVDAERLAQHLASSPRAASIAAVSAWPLAKTIGRSGHRRRAASASSAPFIPGMAKSSSIRSGRAPLQHRQARGAAVGLQHPVAEQSRAMSASTRRTSASSSTTRIVPPCGAGTADGGWVGGSRLAASAAARGSRMLTVVPRPARSRSAPSPPACRATP